MLSQFSPPKCIHWIGYFGATEATLCHARLNEDEDIVATKLVACVLSIIDLIKQSVCLLS
jgi:hypothetical protein